MANTWEPHKPLEPWCSFIPLFIHPSKVRSDLLSPSHVLRAKVEDSKWQPMGQFSLQIISVIPTQWP